MSKRFAALLLLTALAAPLSARAQSPDLFPAPADTSAPAAAAPDSLAPKYFARTALEVTGLNAFIWAWCRYIREGGTNTGFRISLDSWKENLSAGFEWDDNQFDTNQLAHPYHGSMYFCAARANGYSYYESIGFAFAGSAMWEYLGETHHASVNDWISTSVGGIALGEMLHRFSNKIVDNHAQGSERVWREIGGVVVNPMGGVNRAITGEMFHVGPNGPEHETRDFTSALRVGARMTGKGNLGNQDTTRMFVRLRGVVGDPLGSVVRKPYDAFSVDLQFNFDDVSPVGRGEVVGILNSREAGHVGGGQAYFAIVNTWDYINSWAYVLGSQSFGLRVMGRKRTDQWTINSGVGGDWIVLGGTTSDYKSYTGRAYDWGPGLGGKFFVSMRHDKLGLFALESHLYYLHVINGTPANHVVLENRATLSVPLPRSFAIGAEYAVYQAERHYRDFPDVSTRAPQLTTYLSWLH